MSDQGTRTPLRDRLLFVVFWRLAQLFWWVEEWAEAIGNSCEDVAVVKPGHRKTPAFYHRTREIRNG